MIGRLPPQSHTQPKYSSSLGFTRLFKLWHAHMHLQPRRKYAANNPVLKNMQNKTQEAWPGRRSHNMDFSKITLGCHILSTGTISVGKVMLATFISDSLEDHSQSSFAQFLGKRCSFSMLNPSMDHGSHVILASHWIQLSTSTIWWLTRTRWLQLTWSHLNNSS